MKVVTTVAFLVFIAALATAQDLSWTFKWGDGRSGLVFEQNNLASNVKETIRADVELIYSYIPVTNAVFYVYPDGHIQYGKYTGRVSIKNLTSAYPKAFDAIAYKIFNTTNYFCMTKETSEAYVERMALTNTLGASAFVDMTNFLNNAENMNPATTTTGTFLEMWWSLGNNSTLPMDEDDSPQAIMAAITDQGGYFYHLPSILDFQTINHDNTDYVVCTIRMRKKNDMTKGDTATLIFISNKWYFLAFET